VNPRAGLDAMVKRKIPSGCGESNPDHPTCSLVSVKGKVVPVLN